MNTAVPALPSFCPDTLMQELAQSPSPLPVIRPLLQRLLQESHAYFRATLDADTLVPHRSGLIDQILQCLWRHQQVDETVLALVAVGGYGRGELHPHSDIDVLLLAKDDDSINAHAEQLQSFITLLWDLKLDIGHSVRTLDECVTEAKKDLTIITNMMESRLLIGADHLLTELKARTQPDHIWPAQQFFREKWHEIQERHRKHKDSEYNLEPNVKNSPGTLPSSPTILY